MALLVSWELQGQTLDSIKSFSLGLADQGLYSEAIRTMDAVYDLAKSQGNDSIMISALYYRIKWITNYQENLLDSLIKDCEEISLQEKGLIRNFIHLWLGNLYLQYFWSNRDIIQEGVQKDSDAHADFRKWSRSRLYEVAEFHFNAAMLGDLNFPVLNFKEFVDFQGTEDVVFRPTLYEVFFDRWLEFHVQQSKSKDAFSEDELMTDTLLFATGKNFRTNIQKYAGKKSYMDRILSKFGELVNYQLDKGHHESFLDYELTRLKLGFNYSLRPDKDMYFIGALNELLIENKNNSAVHLIHAEMAEYFYRVKGDAATALASCETAINKFPESYGAKKCKLLRNDILRPEIAVSGNQVVLPGQYYVSHVTVRNIPALFIKIVKIPALHDIRHNDSSQLKAFLETAKTVFTSTCKVNRNTAFEPVTIDYKIPPLPLGKYLLIWSDNSQPEKWNAGSPIVTSVFHVSKLGYFTYSGMDSLQFVVFDRKTGNGISGVDLDINALEYTYDGLQSSGRYFLRSDNSGRAALIWDKPYLIKTRLWKGSDTLGMESQEFAGVIERGDRSFQNIELYTDRSIYRPGQIMYFKGLLLTDPGTGIKSTISYKRVDVVLYDANNEKITSGNFTTNSTGAFSASFIIPEDRLLGTYYIQASTSDGIAGSRAIQVEAYKRPSFYVEFLNELNENQLEDSIIVSGQVLHFDLSPVSDARFTYQIYRSTPFVYNSPEFRRGMTSGHENYSLYSSGEGVAGSDGSFAIHFKNIYEKFKPSNSFRFASGYRIEVTVTDSNGESQIAKKDIYPEFERTDIKVSWPNEGDVFKLPPLEIELIDQHGSVNGSFKMYRLKKDAVQLFRDLRKKYQYIQGFDPWVYLQQRKDSLLHLYEADVIYKGRLTDAKMASIQRLMSGGIYVVQASPEESDELKNPLVSVHLFSDVENGITLGDSPWSFLMTKNTYSPGQISEIKCAGNHRRQEVFVIVEKNGLVLETFQRKIFSGGIISIPVKFEYTGDIFIHLVYARNGGFYKDTLHLRVPLQNRKINLEMISGIKTLKPGSEVVFSFRMDPKGTDLSKTELLACMYDASLDQFTSHLWNTQFDQSSYSYLMFARPGFDRVYGYCLNPGWNFKYDTVSFYERKLPSIQWPAMTYNQYDMILYKNGVPRNTTGQPDMLAAESAPSDGNNTSMGADSPAGKGMDIWVRKDFRETAFFYPHIKVDESGEIHFQCKVPDALTKWKLMLFAHSEVGQTGYFEEFFSTSMDAVIFPNTPRFLITGDSLVVIAKLANNLSSTIDGKISLDMIDALTGDTIQSHIDRGSLQQEVAIGGNSSSIFSWAIKAEEDLPAFVRFVFRYTGSASGDEIQVEIPVQRPMQLQRITRPFVISEHAAKKIQFPIMEQLKSNLTEPVQFTVELAQNPLWFAIQALPYMEANVFESSDQLMQRIFGYQLALEIMDKYPDISEIYSKVLLNDDTQKEDLRISRTLQTPWNMAYVQKRKSQQDVLRFFNLNQCRTEKMQAIDKLKKYQHPDGGYCWFPEGRPDLFLTLNLLEIGGRMKMISESDINGFIDEDALKKAVNFAQSQVLKLIKQDSIHFPEMALYFAYVRSFYAGSLKDKEERELLNLIVNHYESKWALMNIYQKAMYGKVCLEFGNKIAKKVAESLIRQSVYSSEKGRYWNAGTGYRWTELPVERQVLLMEFFNATGGYGQEIKQMAQWLIMQKRIQDWNTTGASMSACYGIFLLDEPGRLDQFDVVVRNEKGVVNGRSDHRQIGYFRKDWYGSQIDSTLASWEFDIPKGRLAWGGLYSTSWNKRETIRPDAIDDLKLTREIYKVDWSKDTVLLEKLDENMDLSVGDRIRVVFYIESKSSFDYLHLQDPGFSGLQLIQGLNGYRYFGNLSVYYQYRDDNVDMFIDFLPKGNYTIYYDGVISHEGKFIQSSAHLSSHFAPEFSASSGSSGTINAGR